MKSLVSVAVEQAIVSAAKVDLQTRSQALLFQSRMLPGRTSPVSICFSAKACKPRWEAIEVLAFLAFTSVNL